MTLWVLNWGRTYYYSFMHCRPNTYTVRIWSAYSDAIINMRKNANAHIVSGINMLKVNAHFM